MKKLIPFSTYADMRQSASMSYTYVYSAFIMFYLSLIIKEQLHCRYCCRGFFNALCTKHVVYPGDRCNVHAAQNNILYFIYTAKIVDPWCLGIVYCKAQW